MRIGRPRNTQARSAGRASLTCNPKPVALPELPPKKTKGIANDPANSPEARPKEVRSNTSAMKSDRGAHFDGDALARAVIDDREASKPPAIGPHRPDQLRRRKLADNLLSYCLDYRPVMTLLQACQHYALLDQFVCNWN